MRTDHRSSGSRPALIVVGVLAALLYANFIIDWVLRGFQGMGDIVSKLEAPGEPNAALLRVTDVICALLVVSLLPWARRRLPAGWWRELSTWSMVVFALGASLAAFVAAPCGPGEACDAPGEVLRVRIHDGSSITSDTAFYVSVAAAWFATRRTGPAWFSRFAWWNFWLGGVAASILFEYFNLNPDPPWAVGFSQRLHILGISTWIVALSVFAAGSGAAPSESPGASDVDRHG
ncbi:MAG: DUF998 domain-containing protein [Marmoricola sp.]